MVQIIFEIIFGENVDAPAADLPVDKRTFFDLSRAPTAAFPDKRIFF